jgi:hypothetical protein
MDFDPIVIKNDKPALMTVVDEGLGPETLPHPRTILEEHEDVARDTIPIKES